MDGSSLAPEALAMLMTIAGALAQQPPRRQPPPPTPPPSTSVISIDLTSTTPPHYETPSPSANPHRDEVNRQLVGGTGSVSSGVGVGDRNASPNFSGIEPGKRKIRSNVIAQGSNKKMR